MDYCWRSLLWSLVEFSALLCPYHEKKREIQPLSELKALQYSVPQRQNCIYQKILAQSKWSMTCLTDQNQRCPSWFLYMFSDLWLDKRVGEVFIQPCAIAKQYVVCFCVHQEGNWIGWPGRGQSKLFVFFSAPICLLFNHGMLQKPSAVLGWDVFQCTVRWECILLGLPAPDLLPVVIFCLSWFFSDYLNSAFTVQWMYTWKKVAK